MKINESIPDNDVDYVNWFNKLVTKLPDHSVTLAVTAPEIDALSKDLVWAQFSTLQAALFEEETAERFAYKRALLDGPVGGPATPFPELGTITVPASTPVAPGIRPRVRKFVQRLKNHPNFTEAIARDLGLIAPESTAPDVVKPVGKAEPLAGSEVQVSYIKGDFDGVQAESRRGTETAWTSLGVKIRSSFVDKRPLLEEGRPEGRTYRLKLMRGDTPVGDWSDVFSTTVSP